jgi:hypothetical protein
MPTQRHSNTPSRKESPDGRELLILELQEIHSAESQLSRVLPRLAKSSVSDALRSRLEERLTRGERILSASSRRSTTHWERSMEVPAAGRTSQPKA